MENVIVYKLNESNMNGKIVLLLMKAFIEIKLGRAMDKRRSMHTTIKTFFIGRRHLFIQTAISLYVI